MTRRDRLDEQAVFYLACREAFRAGAVGGAENQLLNRLRRWLGLTQDTARKLGAAARREARLRPAEAGVDLTPGRVLHQAWRFALRKQAPTDAERALLAKLEAFLQVPGDLAEEVRDLAAAERLGGQSITGDAADPPGPEPTPGSPLAPTAAARPSPLEARAAPPPEHTVPTRPLLALTLVLLLAAAGQVGLDYARGYQAGREAALRQEAAARHLRAWRRYLEGSRAALAKGDAIQAHAALEAASEYCAAIDEPGLRYLGLGLTEQQLMLTRMEEIRRRPAARPFQGRLEAELFAARVMRHGEAALVYLAALTGSTDASRALAATAREYADFLAGIGRTQRAEEVRRLLPEPPSSEAP